MDFAVVRVQRFGGDLEHAIQVAVHRERAHPLGHWSRADGVEPMTSTNRKKRSSARPVVTAAHDVAQAALANDLRGVAQQDQQ